MYIQNRETVLTDRLDGGNGPSYLGGHPNPAIEGHLKSGQR